MDRRMSFVDKGPRQMIPRRVSRAGSEPAAVGSSQRPVVKPLRVALLLSTRYFEDFYGASLGLTRTQYLDSYRNDWSWDWCRMLSRQGVQTTIYITSTGAGEHVTTADGYAVRFLPLGRAARPWVRFPVLERSPVGRYVGQTANALAFLAPLRAALAADRVDVLCVQEYWTARFDVIVRALRQPVVAVDQGVPDRRELKLIKRGSFTRCAATVAQTEREVAKVARYGGRAQRIPNAVDTRLFRPEADERADSDPVILCVGRLLDVQKRISDVIRALALLPAPWRIEIAGTGPDRGALQRLADQLGVSARVTYLGFVSDNRALRDLYRRASVLALPSAYEGLPMVLLEAMSCGTPVVGSDIAAIAEVVAAGETGLLVPVGAPDRLAAALREAVARRAELGRSARAAAVMTYDQAVVGPRLAEILRAARRPVPA
jgi:glycosyltransferase involved in cell wall biosynthesis